MHRFFISDLHLSPDRPSLTQGFIEFLNHKAHHAQQLYILGDLFEYWLGDDIIAPWMTPVLDALAQLTQRGSAIFIMHGNRDFLLGEGFLQHTGAQLLNSTKDDDQYLIELEGAHYLLMHGDSLCTDDHDYMQFRHTTRNLAWQQSFLAKPKAERIAFAELARKKSQAHQSQQPATISDINPKALLATIKHYQTQGIMLSGIIHGHTHRCAMHRIIDQDQRPLKRIVLADWQDHYGQVLDWQAGTLSLCFFEFNNMTI